MASNFLNKLAEDDKKRRTVQAAAQMPPDRPLAPRANDGLQGSQKIAVPEGKSQPPGTPAAESVRQADALADFRRRMEAARKKYPTPVEPSKLSLPTVEESAAPPQRGGLGQEILDLLAGAAYSGDSSLPMNTATQTIGGIRNNPEGVEKALAERKELETKKQAKAAQTAAWAKENQLGASAVSVLTSPLSSADYLQRLVEMNAIGQTIPRENLAPGEVTQALRSGASEDMGAVGKFLYNTGMSGVDSLAASWLGGGLSFAGGAILAGGAAASAANDIKERGGTDEQALIGGAVSGIFESLFESLSISKLDALKEAPVDSVKTLLANLAKNTLTNASEEAATELANTIFDTLYMKELSNYTTAVKAAMEAGMSEQEARALAMREAAAEIGMSALSGGLMGAGMGAAGSAMGAFGSGQAQSAWLSRQTDKAQDSAYQTMAEKGLFSQEASAAAKDAVTKMDQARKRSGISIPLALEWNGSQTAAQPDTAPSGREPPVRQPAAAQETSLPPSGVNDRPGGASAAQETAQEGPGRADDTSGYPQVHTGLEMAGKQQAGQTRADRYKDMLTRRLERMGEPPESAARLGELLGQIADGGLLTAPELAELRENPTAAQLEESARWIAEREAQSNSAIAPQTAAESQSEHEGQENDEGRPLKNFSDEIMAQLTGEAGFQTEDPSIAKKDWTLLDSLGKITGANIQVISSEELARMLDGLRDFIRKLRNALGGNRDSAQVQELEQAAQLWQSALEEAGRAVQAGEERQDTGETRYSIGYDKDNRPFVTVEEDILEGVPQEDWVRTVKDNLRKKFPNGVTVGNRQIEIDGTSRREMTWSGYSQWLRKTNPEVFADKLRATNNADEIIQAARDYVNEGLHHPRSDSIQDFARGVVQLRVGENDYTADVVVGLRSNGTMLLYDLLNLSPAEIQERSQGRQTATPSPGSSRSTATDSSFSISQPGQDVKPLSLPALEDGDVSGSDTTVAVPEGLQLPSPEDGIVSAPGDVIAQAVPRHRSVNDRPGGASAAQDTSENAPLSMAGDADLKKEIERLKRQNQRLKRQMQRTDRAEMDRTSVEKQARNILKEYSSQYDKQALYDRLDALYHGIANQTMSETDMRQEARSIAEDILSESQEQTNGLYEQYLDLRRELRTQGISIAPEYRADLESAGGYEGIRKQYFGTLRITNSGTAVDQVYDHLADRYPELFPDDIAHPADQLLRILDVTDKLSPVMGNPYEQGMDQAVEYLAGELLERYYDTPEQAPTFADKQAKKMAEQRAEDRAKMLEAVAKERAKKETALREMQERYRETDRKRIENQNAAQRRETIRRHADRLGRMLLRPTDKQHIPEEMRGAVLGFVRSLNLESGYSKDLSGNRVYAQEGEQLGTPTKRSEAARALQDQYKALAEKGGFTIDPDMEGYLTELAGMEDTPLSKLGKEDLDTIWKVMRVIEHCITKSNDLLGRSRYATVSEMAERIREQNGNKKDRKNLTGLAGTVDQLLNMDMLTPETYFHKLGEAGEAVFQQMRSAADQQTTVLKEGVERAQELVEESKIDLRKAEKALHTFSTSGGELTLSTAQVMELYVLSKREQALEHIYIGGLKPQGARKGLTEAGRAAPVKVTPSDVAEILETLTPEQRKLADGLQAYLSGDLAKHGNDASMTVYGYEKFKEDTYWPIKVDRNQTKSDVKKEAESKTVAGYGMTKAVKPNAANAVMLRGILDSYTDHLNQMATYSGWLAASEDVNRLHNFQFTDEDGNADGTMKTLLEQVYGRGGNRYLDNLMSDVAQGTKAGAEPSFSDRGLNQFKAAKVGGNLRVILQQPTAILRAASMIDPKYFLTAKNPMKGWETAKKYSPIVQWKDWGYFELDTGRSLKELIAGESSKLEAVKNKLMEPAGMADSVAWGHLWNAVEAETAAKHPDLRRGSEDFYHAAAERFGEIIDRTQVVDSVLHRTQIMRSSNSMTRMAASFMSEPSKIYNMVARDLYDIQAAGSTKERGQAGKSLARSAIALIASFAVNAVAQSLPDMWRDGDRDKALKEKFTDAYVSNFLENFDPVGYVPFLKDFESIVQGYSVDRSDLEGFSDVVNALGQMSKALAGESKKSTAAAALELACKGGDMLGLPMTNVKREIAGMVQTALQFKGDVEAQYTLDKLGLNPDKAAAAFYGDLYRAMGTDWEQYENIYKDISENWEQYGGGEKNWDEEKFQEKTKNAMERQMAKDMGLERVSSLPIEYSPPGADRTFDQEVMRQLTKGGSWMDTLPEGTLEQAKALEDLEPEDGADSVTKLQKIQELRDSIWGNDVKDLFLSNILSETEYERLQGARKAGISIEKWCRLYEDISREKVRRTGKGGSPSQADVTAALKKSGLTEKQKDTVWAGYGWKSERED